MLATGSEVPHDLNDNIPLFSLYVWGAAKTIHMGQNKNFEITTFFYSSAFSEQFVLYLKFLAILVPEI